MNWRWLCAMTRRSATQTKYLIRDRDTRFTSAFDSVFEAEGIQILRSPVRAPRADAICDRMIGTIRRELLDRILILHEEHARRANQMVAALFAQQTTPKPRTTDLDQTEHEPPRPINLAEHRLRRHTVLGGITHEYWTATAV